MEEKPPPSHLKRQFLEDEDSNKPPAAKRVRFPKGKKVKPGEEAVNRRECDVEDSAGDLKDPRLAAKERAKRRNQITTELFTVDGRGMLNDVSAAELTYEDNENFDDDGIQIEPFNLNKEREEGYFDADGNFVEYVNEKEIKDAWLDSVDADTKYTGKTSTTTNNEDNDEVSAQDLSSQDIGIIKRRIANALEPGETVLHALRRLKGTSSNRKEKMSAETKHVFDQLTEDAMKLMENGDYNVYHEKQEVFRREAEGYEKLALARGKSIYADVGLGHSDTNLGSDILTDTNNTGITSSVLPDLYVGTSNSNPSAAEVSNDAGETYDMFADDDDDENLKLSSERNSNAVNQSSSEAVNTFTETGDVQNDYVYDESSGYYYSSSLGYYYDPSTGLYCSAASGKWYSFNEATGTYDEVQEAAQFESV